MSIVEQKVRSMIAVPLQTNDRVIGLIYVDSPNAIREFTREDLNLLTVMANVAAIRIEHARLNEIEEAERAMAKEMQQAALIQQQLLGSAPAVEGMDIGAKTVASRAVGGDYYDFIKYPDGRVAMMVGDVAGQRHARSSADEQPAGPRARGVRGTRRPGPENDPAQQEHLRQLSRQPLHHFLHLHRRSQDAASVVYTNAGHNPPLVVRAKGGFETLQGAGGMILGILPMAQYQEANVTLNPGDILVLFSDGVTEAVDPEDQRIRRGTPGEHGGRTARPPRRRDRRGGPSRRARIHARRPGRR